MGHKTVSGVDAPFQPGRDQRQPVAELHHVVDRPEKLDQQVDRAQPQRARCQRVQREQQRLQEHRAGDDLAKAEVALDAPADNGAEHTANTAGAEDESDLRHAGALVLGADDQQQRHRRFDEIHAAGEQRHAPHQLLVPQPAQAGHDLGAQVAWAKCGGGGRRKVPAQSPQREGRDRVAQRVHRQWQGAAELKQRGAQRRPDDAGCSKARLIDRTGLRQLRPCHHTRQRSHFSQVVEDHQRAFQQGHGDDVPQPGLAPQHGQRQAGHGERAADVAHQHHAAAVPAVDHGAHRQAQQHKGRDPQRRDITDDLR